MSNEINRSTCVVADRRVHHLGDVRGGGDFRRGGWAEVTAKQYLSQIKTLDRKIDQKQLERYALRCAAESITPGTECGSGGCASDRVGSIVAHMADLDKEINQDIDRFVDLKHAIINQIHALDDTQYIDVLFKRYVEYKSLEQISVEMCYAYQSIRRLHGYALLSFERKWIHNATP